MKKIMIAYESGFLGGAEIQLIKIGKELLDNNTLYVCDSSNIISKNISGAIPVNSIDDVDVDVIFSPLSEVKRFIGKHNTTSHHIFWSIHPSNLHWCFPIINFINNKINLNKKILRFLVRLIYRRRYKKILKILEKSTLLSMDSETAKSISNIYPNLKAHDYLPIIHPNQDEHFYE